MCNAIGVIDQTYYRWQTGYGEMKFEQAKQFKELDQRNARLKRLLAVLTVTSRFCTRRHAQDFRVQLVVAQDLFVELYPRTHSLGTSP